MHLLLQFDYAECKTRQLYLLVSKSECSRKRLKIKNLVGDTGVANEQKEPESARSVGKCKVWKRF